MHFTNFTSSPEFLCFLASQDDPEPGWWTVPVGTVKLFRGRHNLMDSAVVIIAIIVASHIPTTITVVIPVVTVIVVVICFSVSLSTPPPPPSFFVNPTGQSRWPPTLEPGSA